MRQDQVEIVDGLGRHRLAYCDWGSESAGRTALCVHGLTRNARDFDWLARALVDEGYRVIAVDVVGRGHSSWLDDPKGYRVQVYARQIDAMLESLDLRQVDWIGTSMGGLIALELAGSPRLRSLVLNDVGPFVPREALQLIAEYLSLDLSFASLEEVEKHLRFIHAPFGEKGDAYWRHLAENSSRRDGDLWRLHYDPRICANFAEFAEADIEVWDLWAKLNCPTLILRGGDSVLLSAETMAQMTARNSHASAIEFAGIGHAPALVADRQIKPVLDFLARAGNGAA